MTFSLSQDPWEQCHGKPSPMFYTDFLAHTTQPLFMVYHAELTLLKIQSSVSEAFERARREQRDLDREQSDKDEIRSQDRRARAKKMEAVQQSAKLATVYKKFSFYT